MATKRKGLGRGLDALLAGTSNNTKPPEVVLDEHRQLPRK